MIPVQKYIWGPQLGKGGFAKVYQIQHSSSKKVYACKVVSKENLEKESSQKKLSNEIKIHSELVHQNIVRFHKHFNDDSNVYLLMDLCENTTLSHMMKKRKRLHEIEVKYFAQQICKGLIFLHKNNVIHRDLKLGNIFLGERMQVKIGDFGLSAQLTHRL